MEKKLLNYDIIKKIGDGGMSCVYLGEDPITHQKVAIKELLPNLAHSKDLRERFRREAQIMAKLDHPNIVKLIRYEETGTSFYLIMEYVDGMDLEQHIKDVTGPISEPKAIEIMSTLLDAFGYAHEKGVVHRDIKPANIIITRDGKVKVLDFGIAKIVDENASGRTQTGTRIGTVAYMSPEQVNAAPNIDLRTDVYSLGVMLHQMITGKAAYDTATSSDFEVQTLIVKEPLPRANSIYPYASDRLQKLIDKATQKKRENRFQDCDQFKSALLKNNQKPPELPKDIPVSKPFSPSVGLPLSVGFIIVVLLVLISLSIINKSPNTNESEIPIGNIIDSAVVVIDSTAAPTIIVDSAATSQTENTISGVKKEEIYKKIISFNGGYIVDKIEEYNYDINNSQWILSEKTEQGELYLNNFNLSFKKPSLGGWLHTKLEYDSFDRKNNWYVLNDNYGQKILMDTNFKSLTFLCDAKNNRYLTSYVYYISRKSELVNPNML